MYSYVSRSRAIAISLIFLPFGLFAAYVACLVVPEVLRVVVPAVVRAVVAE